MVLIDRKKIEEQIKEAFKENPCVMGMLLHWIRRQKAVDAVQVVHGEWIYDHWCEFKCSNCGHWSDSKPYKGRENYCPNCGAKMDGGKDDRERKADGTA